MSAAKTKSAVQRKPIRPKNSVQIDDPDGLDIYEVPQISKLSYSVENDNNKFSLKDLVPLEAFEEFVEEESAAKKTKKINKSKKRGRPRKG